MVPLMPVSLLLLLSSFVIAAFPQLHVSQDLYSGRFILADATGREQIIKGINLGTADCNAHTLPSLLRVHCSSVIHGNPTLGLHQCFVSHTHAVLVPSCFRSFAPLIRSAPLPAPPLHSFVLTRSARSDSWRRFTR